MATTTSDLTTGKAIDGQGGDTTCGRFARRARAALGRMALGLLLALALLTTSGTARASDQRATARPATGALPALTCWVDEYDSLANLYRATLTVESLCQR